MTLISPPDPISFVLLIIFSHEYHIEHGVFQAKNLES